ncbi:MAG: PfkB family carbohydrate kinase [Clostridiales bacterium]|nr:PfkB family carbohydrate kinase [Clostridiales bacterium]
MQPGGFIDVYKKLKENGTTLVLDTGWDDKLNFEKYSDYLTVADFYTPNRKETMKITGESTPEKAAYALEKYFDKVVVKVDTDGCIVIDDGELFFVKSVDKFKNTDLTRAGDAFLAGFIYGIFNGCSLKDCIEYGNITGGKAVTATGALSAYVNENELIDYKKKIYG